MQVTPSFALPPRGFVFWLSVGQLVSWGTLYYSFSLFLVHFERDLGLSRVDAAAAFSLALVVEGLLAFPAGRWIERGGARALMSAGSLLAGAGLLVVSHATTQTTLYFGFMLIGAAMAGTLYAPAFAVLIRRYPEGYRRAIITLTFLGGLASTVFIPLCAELISRLGWRHALAVMAGLHWLCVLPIHATLLRGERLPSPAPGTRGDLSPHLRTLPFWGIACFFVIFGGVTTAVAAHLVPMLTEARLPAVWVVAIPAAIGALQTLGRLVLYVAERRWDVHRTNRWVPVLLPFALVLLLVATQRPAVALAAALGFGLCFGLANGMNTIVKATAMAQYVSQAYAGSLNGLIGLPASLARAAGPSMVAALWLVDAGYRLALVALILLASAAAAAFWLAQRRALAASARLSA